MDVLGLFGAGEPGLGGGGFSGGGEGGGGSGGGVPGGAGAGVHQVPAARDALGDEIQSLFTAFLRDFGLRRRDFGGAEEREEGDEEEGEEGEDEEGENAVPLRPIYLERLATCLEDGVTTLYVDFDHIYTFDQTLSEAIEQNFLHVQPRLGQAVVDAIEFLQGAAV
jgi:MCM N-terminal domain